MKLIILFVVLMNFVGIKAFAFSPVYKYDIIMKNDDGVTIYYKWINNKTELAVYYEYSYEGETYSPYSGNIVIPKFIEYSGKTYNVTSIGEHAFYGCSGLTSITIPNSVTSIGNYAFSGCSSLTSVTIPNSVTDIGTLAFYGCSSLTSVTIPNSVTSIGGDAFSYTGWYQNQANGLLYLDKWLIGYKGDRPVGELKIVEGTKGIAEHAFSGCSGLTSVTIPNSVTSIGNDAFDGCSGLTSVTIPNSVTSIGSSAFYGCSGLTKIISEIENPFSISDNAFYYYDKDIYASATLVVPPGKKSIYQNTNGWKQFSNIVEAELIGYMFESGGIRYRIGQNNTVSVISKKGGYYSGDVVIPSSVVYHGKTYSVKSIEGAFAFCDDLTSVTIPNSVTSIGEWAFYESCLPFLTIPNSVMSIGFEAFKLCSLTSVTIPNSVALIGPQAFSDCGRLATVVSEMENPCEIVSDAFSYINANATLIVPPSTKSAYQSKAGWNKFANIVEIEKKQTIHVATAGTLPDLIPDYEKYYIEELTLTGELNGTDLAFLREMAGRNRMIHFHEDYYNFISDLKDGEAFSSETQGKLIDLDILNANIVSGGSPSLVFTGVPINYIYSSDNTIPAGLFFDCKLSSIKLPRSISNIESLALGHCPLTYITIPNSVTSISDDVFWGCSSLESMVVENSNTKYDSRNNCKAIIETESNTLIAGCKNTIIPNSVTTIGSDAFASCSGLTSVTFPNSVTSIGKSAFYNCSGLTSVTIPNSVTSIGISAFSGCNNLKYICLASDKYPSSYSLGNTTCQYIMPQSAFDAGIPQDITNYATYTVAPKYITVKSTTATTATLELTPIDLTGGSTGGATPYEVTMYGLNPGSSVKGSWELETKDRGLASIPTVTTKNLVMNVQPAKLLSKEKAGLTATVNEPDDDKHYGFEWQRNDAPSNMTPYQVNAQLYEGKIIGTLSGLDPDKYYKYRPFYKADDGTLFRGEWEAFITGDATVTFEPDVHTKESVILPDGNIELTLVLADGTEMTLEKGFELRIIVRQAATRSGWSAEDENITRVVVSGDGTRATVEGLEPGTEYAYRAYVKTESGTIYGEEKTFKTPLPGDANDNGAVDAADIVELVNAKAGHPSASFNLNNADANADGSFTEADITATADIIMKR